MTRNVGHRGQPGETFAANVGFLIVALVLMSGRPSVGANLLTNPGFETGSLTGWIVANGSASILTQDVRSGTQAARLANAEVRQGWINVARGRAYKAFAWVRIASETGSDWGGFRVEVVDSNWRTLAHAGALLTATHGTNWFKVALTFTASTPTVMFMAGYFGGSSHA